MTEMEKKQNVSKDDILDNYDRYSIEELCNFVMSGDIPEEELMKFPHIDNNKKKQIKERLDQNKSQQQENSQEEADWKKAVDSDTISAYNEYLEKYPDGIHRDTAKEQKKMKAEAQPQIQQPNNNDDDDFSIYQPSEIENLISRLKGKCGDVEAADLVEKFLNSGENNRKMFLEQLKEDPNLITSGTMYNLCINRKCITAKELRLIFDEKFIEAMVKKVSTSKVSDPANGITIDQQCTEVYFWGISGSGKSCVLASLFSVLSKGSMGTFTGTECNGKGYMDDLKKILKEKTVCALLPGNEVGKTYEMSFNVTLGKKTHPFTFVDIAGGILYLMYNYMDNKDVFNSEANKANREILEQLKGVIKDKLDTNRKMHFFVLEYGAERWEKNGKTQDDYLTTSFDYLKQLGIYNKATDGIYIIVTKSDIAKRHGADVDEVVKKYIKEHYMNFYKNVSDECAKQEIDFDTIPYSIGTVCMKNLCEFNPAPAKNILEKMINVSFSNDGSRWGKLKSKFRK